MQHPSEADYTMDEAQRAGLAQRVAEGALSETYTAKCNSNPDDHLHATVIGRRGDGLAGRIGVQAHDDEQVVTVYIAAAQARMFAAALLNGADALDGVVPLRFFPPSPDAEDPFDEEGEE